MDWNRLENKNRKRNEKETAFAVVLVLNPTIKGEGARGDFNTTSELCAYIS